MRARLRLRNRRGASAIILVLMIPVVVGMVAITVDIGRLAMERQRLTNVCDACAKAGGIDLPTSASADVYADLDRAEEAATRHGVPRWGDVEAVFRDDEVEVVVSLTPPLVHHEIIGAAAAAGKHVFTEKPLSASTALAAKPATDLGSASGIPASGNDQGLGLVGARAGDQLAGHFAEAAHLRA